MVDTPSPVDALRKALNAYTVSQEAMVAAAAELKPAPLPPADNVTQTEAGGGK